MVGPCWYGMLEIPSIFFQCRLEICGGGMKHQSGHSLIYEATEEHYHTKNILNVECSFC